MGDQATSGQTPMYPPRLAQAASSSSWGVGNASYSGVPQPAPSGYQPNVPAPDGRNLPPSAYQPNFPPPSPAPGHVPSSSALPPHGQPHPPYYPPPQYGGPQQQPPHSFPVSGAMSVGGHPSMPPGASAASMSISYAGSLQSSYAPPSTLGPSPSLATQHSAPLTGTPQMHPLPHPSMQPHPHHQMQPGVAMQPPTMAPQQQPALMGHNSIYTGPSYAPHGPAGVAHIQAAEVKLEISCKGLRDRDVLTKSDPCAVVFLEEKRYGMPGGYPGQPQPGPQAQQHVYMNMQQTASASPNEVTHWREVGRTESMKDNLNPHFSVHVTVPYRFEELQNIRIGIWDIDTRHKELHTHDFLGDIRTTLGDLVAAGITEKALNSQNQKENKTITGAKRNWGNITIIVHEMRDGGKLLVKGHFSGKKLAKRDLFSSDPYLIFTQLAVRGAHSRSQVHVTEVIKKSRNPVWKPVKFKVDLPKGGNHSHIKLEILCNDKDYMSLDDEIGIANCTLEELLKVQKLPLIFSKKKGKRGYKDSGQLVVKDMTAVRLPSLIEYLQGGLKLHFSVAVDLTASNGDPRDPTSLHYLAPGYPNEYVRALSTIGGVLQHYAPSDGMFNAYGFGAELPGQQGVASSCFALNMQHNDMRCTGIDGIINAYQRVLQTVRLSGPTNFSPLIEEATRTALSRTNTASQQNYDVLLILTDGVVTDYNRTVERIIDASMSAPLSIIIIGVGRANFEKMHKLDADNQLLQSVDGRRTAARDIVQFVPLRDFLNQPPDRLASSVLAEMPENIVDYFISRTPAIMPCQSPMRPDGQAPVQ